jgi:CheY-like chemotaxis protein
MARILIVEDDPAWRSLYRMALETQFEVFEAMDGYQAVSVLEAVKPDVILLDLRMPKMDGYDFVRRLDRHGSRPAIVVCSGTITDGDRPAIPNVYLAAKTPDLRDVWTALRALVPGTRGAAAPAKPVAAVEDHFWRD